jgi:methionyl-tRNA formyltransferase
VRNKSLRLVLFVDPLMFSSVSLLAGSLEIAADREDIEVVAIVDAGVERPRPLRLPRTLAAWSVRRICNLGTGADPQNQPLFITPAKLAHKWGVPVLVPRDRRVNDEQFVETLRALEPDATIALMVAQIFRSPLLEACDQPLNYHDGLLPDYQGVAATGWSIYEGAPRSGFTFHRMNEMVDQGPILLQGDVAVGPGATAARLERAKTALARSQLGTLFDLLIARVERAPGPARTGSSFSRAARHAIRTIEDPEALSLDELELRLRAFEIIDLTLAGRPWRVTALRRVAGRPHNRGLAFTTADGVLVEPSRTRHLPPVVDRALGLLRRHG